MNFESSHLPPRRRLFAILCRLESSIKSVIDTKKFQKLGSQGGVTRQVGLEIQPNLLYSDRGQDTGITDEFVSNNNCDNEYVKLEPI